MKIISGIISINKIDLAFWIYDSSKSLKNIRNSEVAQIIVIYAARIYLIIISLFNFWTNSDGVYDSTHTLTFCRETVKYANFDNAKGNIIKKMSYTYFSQISCSPFIP